MTSSPETTAAPLKVVVAKPGLDGHDRGAKIVARALRDSGMEVVYTGIYQTSLSGAHLEYAKELGQLLRDNDRADVLFVAGGTIPPEDAEVLKTYGVHEVFGPGTPTTVLVDYIATHARNVPSA
jgi:methylmalonyl-CoA mutase C-terminal domain/subunit